MPEWAAIVRERFHGRHALSDAAVEELAQHLEETYRAARSAGRSETDALALARAQLDHAPARLPAGMVERPHRGMRGWLPATWRDLRHAGRILRARPGFTAVAVVTLALGIGANTAIFSVVRSLVLEPLPFSDPARLVMIWEADVREPSRPYIVSAPNFLDWRRLATSFESMGLWEYLNVNVSGDAEAERVPGLRLSASTFAMLGVPAELGRTFTAEEDEPGHAVAVISHALWQVRYGGRSDIVGHLARINGQPFEIVGVMPARFRFPSRLTGVWLPIAFNAVDAQRDAHSFQAGGRLRAGVTFETAAAEMDAIGRALSAQHPAENQNETATVTRMPEYGVADLRPILLALSGVVALVLAIACVNVANLLLAQSSGRRQEFAIRTALGASLGRLAAQMLLEALAIALIGGATGVAVAWGGVRLLQDVLPASIVSAPFRDAGVLRLDHVVLGFTGGIAVITGLLFGLAPIVGLRPSAADLKAAGDRGATGRATGLRTTLVAAEVALALVVLMAAGLMIKSLERLLRNDPGLDPSNVLVVTMSLPQPDSYGPPVRERFCDQVAERVGTLPGILSVGAVSHLPLSGANASRGFGIEGRSFPPGEGPSASYRLACPGYFQTFGVPLLKGRDFDARDTTRSPGVVIVNEETANRYWPGGDPIGRRITIGRGPEGPWLTIVGVVGNIRHFGLDDIARREIFRPYSQAAWPGVTIVAKTPAEPAAFAASVRGALQAIDRDLPVGRVTTMEAIAMSSTGTRRFPMLLFTAFGAVALALAIVGVYGVVSYVVAQRTREIGIRVALGARRGQVIRLVLVGAMRPVAAGLVVGSVSAVSAARMLGTMLYEVKPGDPSVLAVIAALLAGAAIAASLVPGARATRVDPIAVLKAD